jgi:hypothetical protein
VKICHLPPCTNPQSCLTIAVLLSKHSQFVNSRIRIWKPKYEAMQKQQKQQHKGKKAPQRSALAKKPSQCTSDERYRNALPSVSESKTVLQTVTRRVSLVPPSPPTERMVHQVSDASLHPSDISSTSSSSVDGDDVSVPHAHKRLSLDMIAFTSPPRSQKRPRVISEGGDLLSPPPQPRYAQEDAEEWKQACLRSPQLDDQSLPTFDEAARLFGYSLEA